MKPPIRRLTKDQLIWLSEHQCRHAHTFLDHYSCFLSESPSTAPFHERVGYLDIESTGLKGNWDYMLCWCLKIEGGKILGRHLERKEIVDKFIFDRDLTKELINEVRNFDRIITYYGSRFDIPFIKTRAEKWGLDFPAYRDLWQTDCYDLAKHNLLLHSTRLMHVCDLMGIPSKEHKLIPDIWMKAKAGHVPSLEWIFTHCKEDVISLEEATNRLKKYSVPAKRSL